MVQRQSIVYKKKLLKIGGELKYDLNQIKKINIYITSK